MDNENVRSDTRSTDKPYSVLAEIKGNVELDVETFCEKIFYSGLKHQTVIVLGPRSPEWCKEKKILMMDGMSIEPYPNQAKNDPNLEPDATRFVDDRNWYRQSSTTRVFVSSDGYKWQVHDGLGLSHCSTCQTFVFCRLSDKSHFSTCLFCKTDNLSTHRDDDYTLTSLPRAWVKFCNATQWPQSDRAGSNDNAGPTDRGGIADNVGSETRYLSKSSDLPMTLTIPDVGKTTRPRTHLSFEDPFPKPTSVLTFSTRPEETNLRSNQDCSTSKDISNRQKLADDDLHKPRIAKTESLQTDRVGITDSLGITHRVGFTDAVGSTDDDCFIVKVVYPNVNIR